MIAFAVVPVRRKRPRFTTKPVALVAESDALAPSMSKPCSELPFVKVRPAFTLGLVPPVLGSVCPRPVVRPPSVASDVAAPCPMKRWPWRSVVGPVYALPPV